MQIFIELKFGKNNSVIRTRAKMVNVRHRLSVNATMPPTTSIWAGFMVHAMRH
jgi:hypothetical protein